MPDLLDLQTQSFEWLVGDEAWFQRRIDAGDENPMGGLEEILTEISPIEDFSGSMSLSFSDPRFDEVKASERGVQGQGHDVRGPAVRHGGVHEQHHR